MAAARMSAAHRGIMVAVGGRRAVILLAETNQLASGSGRVGIVTMWGDTAGTGCTIILYDATSGTTLPFWSWATAQGLGVFPIQAPFGIGLRVITAGTMPVNGGATIVWEGADA
jgi:hypothetical protein